MITLQHYLLISAVLFCIGLFAVMTKRNAIVMLMGVELMLNAANINLVAFSKFDAILLQGQMFSIFVIVIAAADFKLPITSNAKSKLPVTVKSADDQTVTVTDTSRIIVLNDAIADIVISLGFFENIIGRDATTTLEMLKAIPKVSSGHDVSAESVLALSPTLIIGDTRSGPPEAIQQLRGAGVSILLAPEVWQLSDIAPRISLIAEALGVKESGQKLLQETQTQIDQALTESKTIR